MTIENVWRHDIQNIIYLYLMYVLEKWYKRTWKWIFSQASCPNFVVPPPLPLPIVANFGAYADASPYLLFMSVYVRGRWWWWGGGVILEVMYTVCIWRNPFNQSSPNLFITPQMKRAALVYKKLWLVLLNVHSYFFLKSF